MQRIQIFSPHPDDVEIFVGGTMLRHFHDGDKIQVVMMTHGGLGTKARVLQGSDELKRTRIKESNARIARMPGAELVWLDFKDASVQCTPDGVLRVKEAIASYKPDLIYLPESARGRSFYRHSDHIQSGQMIEQAAAAYDASLTLRYYHSAQQNLLIDVSAHLAENEEALKCYRSQDLVSTDPPLLLTQRRILRWLFAPRLGLHNPFGIHRLVNRVRAAANLPAEPGTEAFREERIGA